MLKIGEFSKLSRVSVRMLRHYDDIGLLKPIEIDCFTGYRYYEVDQLLTVGRITSLKDMGFKLADIIKILDIYDDRNTLETYLETRREEVEVIYGVTAYQMMLLDTAIKRLRKEEEQMKNDQAFMKAEYPEKIQQSYQWICGKLDDVQISELDLLTDRIYKAAYLYGFEDALYFKDI